MGWGKPKAGGWWHGSQQYGSWNKQKPPPKDQDTKAVLAPYDKTKVDQKEKYAAEMIQVLSHATPGGGEDTLLKDLQTCVNNARKSENKVKRLIVDKHQRLAQWAQYEKTVKAEFLAEKARHQKDLDNIESELTKAIEAQEMARARVRQAAQGPTPQSQVLEQEAADHAAWQANVDTWEAEQQDDGVLREVLARALTGTPKRIAAAPPPGLEVAAATPPPRGNPRTPTPQVLPKHGQVSPAQPGAGTRLVPFPPPKRARVRAMRRQTHTREQLPALDRMLVLRWPLQVVACRKPRRDGPAYQRRRVQHARRLGLLPRLRRWPHL